MEERFKEMQSQRDAAELERSQPRRPPVQNLGECDRIEHGLHDEWLPNVIAAAFAH